MQDVKQLALVLVNPLNLHVEQPLRIECDPAFRLHQFRQAQLVGLFDLMPLPAELRIIDISGDSIDLLQVGHPPLADPFADQPAQLRVATRDPAPRRDSVGLVVELVRPELVKIPKKPLGQQL